jgi:hypothetical protein
MKKDIEFHKQKISYVVKRNSRARTMRLAIYADGRCVVIAPHRISTDFIERFLCKHAQWVVDKLIHVRSLPKTILLSHKRKDFLKYKEAARTLARARVEYFSEIYGITCNAITIRNQKTRWGSCSRKGNLSFNYKIALLPSHLVDYIVVHELCHRVAFNHSSVFWELVARTMPNHKALRRELKLWRGANGAVV